MSQAFAPASLSSGLASNRFSSPTAAPEPPLRVDLIFPVLPPTLDGIGDHTAHLAAALADRASVRILTAQSDVAPIPGVTVCPAFSTSTRRGVLQLVDAVRRDPPDWLLLQFNQFSYGRWGFNPFLPLALWKIRRQCPQTRIAWLAHEDFVPLTSWRFAIMTIWQRAQFWSLGCLADAIFFTIEPWVRRYASWFPQTPVVHLPVGSNIPRVEDDGTRARRTHDIPADAFVVGVFGGINAARLVPFLKQAVEALHGTGDPIAVLYVGRDGPTLQSLMAPFPVIDAGPLPAEEVSQCFSAMDLHLTPYVDGVSTRRGAFMAGLQHGVPTLGTSGPLTDPILATTNGDAFDLVSVNDASVFAEHALALYRDDDRRQTLSTNGQAFFEAHYSWPSIADRFLSALQLRPQ